MLAVLGADHGPRKFAHHTVAQDDKAAEIHSVASATAVAHPAVRSDPFTAVLAWYPRIEHVQQHADGAVVLLELHSTIVALSGVQNQRVVLPCLLLTLT